jgi:hypothetical protein
MRLSIFKTSKEAGDAKRTNSTLLSVFLLGLSDKASHILNGGLIFVAKAVRLALNTSLVNQNSGVGLESRECDHKVLINLLDLSNSAGVLKLCDGVLLDSEDDAVFALEANSAGAAVDSFEGVLYLEELAIGGKHSDSFIVSGHILRFK